MESAEHVWIGDQITLSFPLRGPQPAKKCLLDIDGGHRLTYGQLIALGGDLYGVPDAPISTAANQGQAFIDAWHTLTTAEPKDVRNILDVVDVAVNEALRLHQRGHQAPLGWLTKGGNNYLQLTDNETDVHPCSWYVMSDGALPAQADLRRPPLPRARVQQRRLGAHGVIGRLQHRCDHLVAGRPDQEAVRRRQQLDLLEQRQLTRRGPAGDRPPPRAGDHELGTLAAGDQSRWRRSWQAGRP